MKRIEEQLTPHFSLFELTVTSNPSLQEQNRDLDDDQMLKLKALAQFAEGIRHICGDQPIRIHSGYRCAEVNGATPGSSNTSQHMRCEALDFDIPGQDISDTFNRIFLAAKEDKQLCFGQLIDEAAERNYGISRWVHCSVVGTLDPAKVGEVMKAVAGEDGRFSYTLLEKLNFG